MKKSNREHGQRTRAKGFLSRDDKVDLLYSCLQNFGSEGAQFTRDEVRSWFENNTLGKVQLNGRRMSDILSDCQRGKSLEQLRPNLHLYSSSDSTSDSGMASCPEAVADLLDEAAIVCNNQETSGASFHSSSLESGGLQSSYLPTYQSAPGETISQNTDSVSKLTFSEVQTRTHNQADRHGPSFKRYDGLAESSGRTTAKRLPIPFDSEDSNDIDQWFNREYGGIENIEKLFPTSKEDASLEMKPLRIPPDDKWLESYTSLLCNGGKPPPSAGPYHPAVLMAHLKGHQHMFIKGWPLLDEPK